MILVRSPLRISLGGGGTDLPSYYRINGGFVLSAAINKYVYVGVNRPFSPGIVLKYSSYEKTRDVESINHPIIREALRIFNPIESQIEISTMADIPSGTGLGSSGSFTTALLKALSLFYKSPLQTTELAELACKIEIEILGEPIGKQDQYIAAYGGFTTFEFQKNGKVETNTLVINPTTIEDLQNNLLLFYTGTTRPASQILQDQNTKTLVADKSMVENLDFIKNLGYKSRDFLASGNTVAFGDLMKVHWEFKQARSRGITTEAINLAYETALQNGAVGGKLVGAGGGGFLMFYASDSERLRGYMTKSGMEELLFDFDFQGTSVVIS
jgi:D-glycero-alpha-D-manno-heptose-7-phosphate kinase